MQIVIDIPDSDIPKKQELISVDLHFINGKVCECTYPFEELTTPRSGRWKRVSMDKYVQHAMAFYRCSECGEDIIGEHNYCPTCGTKMEV